MWVAKRWCSCTSMHSCVLGGGGVQACCFVLSCFEGWGGVMSAACVLWYVPHSNTGLSNHGDPVFLPLEPEPGPWYRHRGEGGYLSVSSKLRLARHAKSDLGMCLQAGRHLGPSNETT